jgi:hypothetical protein
MRSITRLSIAPPAQHDPDRPGGDDRRRRRSRRSSLRHMPFITRQVAAVACLLALSAAPALASATPSSTGAVKAKTALTAKITDETPFVEVKYSRNYGGLGRNAVVTDDAALVVSRIPADSAQLPEKWEWVLGADLQQRADNIIAYGEHEEVYHHPTTGKRLVNEGVADLRLSNYFFANADSLLGVRHPKYMAAPYQPYKNKPVKSTTPLIATAPKPTLAGIIAMGTPLLKQTLPVHILSTYLRRNQAAANYYSLVVARMHVDPAQRSAQHDWVEGVRTLGRGDEQLNLGIITVRYGHTHLPVTGKHEIQSGLTTLRLADSQISHADALLGVHQSGRTVRVPTKIIYLY